MGLFGKKYEFFISYRSKNASIARQIADMLAASGRKAWFAEYEILLDNREKFQEEIDRAVPECKFGIALTNDLYTESGYCDREMQLMLKNQGPSKIIEIQIPPEPKTREKYGALKGNPAVVWDGNLSSALKSLSSFTGYKLIEAPPLPENNGDGLLAGIFDGVCIKLGVAGWEEVPLDPLKMNENNLDCTNIGNFNYRCGGKNIFFNILCGYYNAKEARNRLSKHDQDDREMYDAICYSARIYRDRMNQPVTGVHLLHAADYSQVAFTYKFYPPMMAAMYGRRYSVVLEHPKTHMPVEFVFTFGYPADFSDLCLFSQVMDDVVVTLKWAE